ncbi:adenosylcobinamide-GDP ribazoletransferase [Anaerotalea alkaliphila]|uniref:Adenosylcobinamide-GDP ribazoletransferase n=1 Tax=Anaerotalea alkaliphila TaxID=2662126 RepID=A0A7X5HX97_9FIRM|nr:adenosylcobinamide-GDP ribazoletransferase [Anaerotalea alkaliphila]NDL68352.1 adenosylcobinamide-GDP ribazoletransferase [Anaerotalea alkaliphila]
MKNITNAIVVAFSMYSKIPMPRAEWSEKNMRYAFVFFPFVGAIISVMLFGLFYIGDFYRFHPVFFGVMCVSVNVAVTGGIHIDGFCDVTDALSSRQGKEEKLRIMKDPNVGAFAVIYTGLLLLVQFGAYVQVFAAHRYLGALLLGFVVSRAMSGLSILLFPCAKSSGLAATFANGANKTIVKAVLVCMLIVLFAAIIVMYHLFGVILFLFAIMMFSWFYFFTKREFGGITGDLAGCFLNLFETAILILTAVAGVVA